MKILELVSWIGSTERLTWTIQLTVVVVYAVVVEQGVDVGEGKVVNIGKVRVILGILESLLDPVVAEPRRGLDQGPPLIREILHHPVCQRHERRSIRIQS